MIYLKFVKRNMVGLVEPNGLFQLRSGNGSLCVAVNMCHANNWVLCVTSTSSTDHSIKKL